MRPLLLLLILLSPLRALGAITADTSTATTAGAGNASSITFAHTSGTCSNAVLQINGTWQRNPIGTLDTATYAGSAATSIGGVSQATPFLRGEMWYRKAPATGVNNVVLTFDATKNSIAASAITYCGVDQTTSIGNPVTASGSDATATAAVSSATGELVIDIAFTAAVGDPITVGAGQTQRANFCEGCANHTQGVSSEPGAGTVTMSWGLNASDYWGIVAVALKPAAAGSAEYYRRIMKGSQ